MGNDCACDFAPVCTPVRCRNEKIGCEFTKCDACGFAAYRKCLENAWRSSCRMGNAGSTSGSTITLSDGTFVGGASETGAAFAKAIQRMHCIFRDCDSEFCDLSEAVNTHGKQSEAVKLAAQRLHACQRRRERQLASIESACGPAQDGYRLCVERMKASGQGHEHDCLPVLHDFLDCAERTLASGGERST